jgi:hypothetical protein
MRKETMLGMDVDNFYQSGNQGFVHMYQEDICGKNPIDNAFEKNSIFSIKLFIDSLLQMNNEQQFRNCFDEALLLMISKGMDVKELINSSLLFVPLWTKYTIFSDTQAQTVATYNNEL